MFTAWPKLRWYHVGPHGFFDLVRLARNGRSASVRVAYILALFAALAISFYSSTPPDSRERQASINWNARIAERFSATILVMQNIAVLVLTPIYMAASIQEERDKGTFPLLFTTHLTAREIVLGKWLSRCVQVGTVLLAGLPVLALAQLWGGIDMPMIVANFLHTGMLLFTIGAFSLVIVTENRSFSANLALAYLLPTTCSVGLWLPLQCCTGTPLSLLSPLGGGANNYIFMWIHAGALAALYIPATAFLLYRAARLLEVVRQEDKPRIQIEPAITNRRNRFWRWPTPPESVVAWKECYLDRSVLHVIPYAVLPFLLLMVTVVSFNEYDISWSSVMSESAALSRTVMLGCFGVYVLLVSVRLTGCIVRERQQRTLETLLTLPIAPRAFLFQKVGNLRRHWIWLLPAGCACLILLLFDEGRLAVGLMLPIVMAVHLAFFAMLGLFLSVVSAHVSLGLILVLLLFGVSIFLSFADFPQSRNLQRGLNPVMCWITIATEWGRQSGAVAASEIIPSVLLYVAAALILWELACQRFVRDPIGA
jgi:ABC-type transport system involved in multi-copper enzyme maturation permease subunit